MARKAKSRYPSMMPPISQPGQRELRTHTMKEEIQRIIYIVAAQCLLAGIALLSTYLVCAIVGPAIGSLGGTIVLYIILKKRGYSPLKNIPLFLLAIIAPYLALSPFWMSSPVPNAHPAVKITIVIAYTFVIAACTWAVYMLWVEMTDPNHPSPRHASQRDNPHVPFFSKETYGGQVLPDISTIASLPSRTITVQLVKDDNGKHTESVAYIPDLTNWREFFYAVSHHGKGFTEATARAYNVPLTDTRDQIGQLIVIGMRTLREQFLSRGWLEWKNASVHERGLNVTPKGQVVMEAIGKES